MIKRLYVVEKIYILIIFSTSCHFISSKGRKLFRDNSRHSCEIFPFHFKTFLEDVRWIEKIDTNFILLVLNNSLFPLLKTSENVILHIQRKLLCVATSLAASLMLSIVPKMLTSLYRNVQNLFISHCLLKITFLLISSTFQVNW